ncbi:MAG: hypothetical protein EHM66_00475 [Deltaproteobacteria bacterium]|nr:MAG: hypothetical protein EHM66_00475 [Deltaproteobacteria bacterium]
MVSYHEKLCKRQRWEGYEFAAGILLKGAETPKSLEDQLTAFDPFDLGAKDAIRDAVDKGLCKDDRV